MKIRHINHIAICSAANRVSQSFLIATKIMEHAMKITFSKTSSDDQTLVVPVFEGNVLKAGVVSAALQKFITQSLAGEENFKGRSGQTLTLRGHGAGQKIVLLGVGPAKNMDEYSVRKLAAPLYKALAAEGAKQVSIIAEPLGKPLRAAALAEALLLESYEFKKYKTTADGNVPAKPAEVFLVTPQADKAARLFGPLRTVIESSFWASDLVNEPANALNPKTYADKIRAELSPLGVKVTVLELADMQRLGMGAIIAVGQGSVTPPCMVVMEYDGDKGKQKQPLALVGKGITFDSGGISLKPGAGMGDMTMDMGGSAAVRGAKRARAANKSTANVVAIVALAENMPDSKSYRPGDILKSMNGKTIYVGNTDAEGRLVLADALTYVQRAYNPHTVVDLATLTGAAVAALGKNFAAFYSNDNSLTEKFDAASAKSGERIWRMPLTESDEFTKAVRNTPLADLTNLASGPGSITAAAFLREFIEKDAEGQDKCQWTHIDMAGPGIPDSLRKGWGVRLLNQFVQDNYEPSAKKPPARKSQPARRR